MTERISPSRLPFDGSERPVAAVGAAAGFAALVSAAACCVLPAAFAVAGLGAGGLAAVVPYHWPLTIASGVAVAAGWALYVRKRRECGADAACAVAPPARTTVLMLSFATAFVLLSAAWKAWLEAPLQAWLLTR